MQPILNIQLVNGIISNLGKNLLNVNMKLKFTSVIAITAEYEYVYTLNVAIKAKSMLKVQMYTATKVTSHAEH